MKISITHAVRLRRKDIFRLTELHQKQCIQAIWPSATLDKMADLVEEGEGNDNEEVHGLVYLRIADDKKNIFEGWFLDYARYPQETTSLDGGAFFKEGTCDEIGLSMSQSSYAAEANPLAQDLLKALQKRKPQFSVKVKGKALTENPPFALKKAPKPILPKEGSEAMDIEIIKAERYIMSDIKSASPEVRFQFVHGLRPKFAPATIDTLDTNFFGFPTLINFVDPGPEESKPGHMFGLIHVVVQNAANPSQKFEGWFFDARFQDEESYWPSTKAQLSEGRFFIEGTIEFTGVYLKNGKVYRDKKAAYPFGETLMNGVKSLDLNIDVQLKRQHEKGEKGYFGSKFHQQQIEDHERNQKALKKLKK